MNVEKPNRIEPDDGLTLTTSQLEQKIFKLTLIMVLSVSIITFIQNLILKTNNIQIILSIVCALLSLGGLIFITRMGKHRLPFYIVLFSIYFILIILWFYSAGFSGSTPSLFFVLITVGVVFVRSKHRIPVMVIILVTLILLLVVEYNYPALVKQYDNSKQRFLDSIITYLASIMGTGFIIYLVFKHYLGALQEIKILKGILPICANCKKIRSADESWDSLESYISKRSEAKFSHSICPECAKKLYPELYP